MTSVSRESTWRPLHEVVGAVIGSVAPAGGNEGRSNEGPSREKRRKE
jgi:hypothetical protein